MLAKINGVFRLTRDAELKYTQSGVAILNIGLACSEKYKDNEKQLFLDATAFGKAGELINQYAGRKGTQISLAGKLETQQWVDQQNNKRSKVSFIIEDFEFLGSKNDGNYAPQRDATTQGSNNYNGHNRYEDNPPASNQPQTYEGKPDTNYAKQQAYQAPTQQMPASDSVPVIDIDEDIIPF